MVGCPATGKAFYQDSINALFGCLKKHTLLKMSRENKNWCLWGRSVETGLQGDKEKGVEKVPPSESPKNKPPSLGRGRVDEAGLGEGALLRSPSLKPVSCCWHYFKLTDV